MRGAGIEPTFDQLYKSCASHQEAPLACPKPKFRTSYVTLFMLLFGAVFLQELLFEEVLRELSPFPEVR